MEIQYRGLRFWVDEYYSIQKHRIEVGNFISACRRDEEEPDAKILRLFEQTQEMEKSALATIADVVKPLPLYEGWLKQVKGIGPCFAGGLVAHVRTPERFATISKLWAYAGYGMDGDGKVQRRRKGEKANWNSRFKTLLWKVGESFVKQGQRGFYAVPCSRLLGKFRQIRSICRNCPEHFVEDIWNSTCRLLY